MKHALIILALWTLPAWGVLVRENFEGTRPLGMGGAFLAVADDANALWYNPAGLAYQRGAHFHLLDTHLTVDSMDTLAKVGKAVFDGDYNNLIRDSRQTMGFSVRPTFLTKYFGLTFFDNIRSFTDFRDLDTLDATADLHIFNDVGALLAFGFPFTPYIAFGGSLRIFQRSAIDATVDTQTLLQEVGLEALDFRNAIYNYLQGLAGFGWAVGFNFGGIAHLPVFGKGGPDWTLALAVENVGQTKFRKLGSREQLPPNLRMVYHVGTAFRWNLSKTSDLTLAADYRHMVENLPAAKKIHLGGEYRTSKFDFRLGLYQLRPTFGFGIKFPAHTRVNFSSHAVELGDSALSQGQRLYQIQLTLGFNPL